MTVNMYQKQLIVQSDSIIRALCIINEPVHGIIKKLTPSADVVKIVVKGECRQKVYLILTCLNFTLTCRQFN